MCGIIYVKRKDGIPAAKAVMKRYREQKSRGQQGFGYVAIKNNQVVDYQRTAHESDIMELLSKETAEEILFHHRFPTSTPNFPEAAHPILIQNDEHLKHSWFIVHNGVITNTEELIKKHEKLGFTYKTLISSYFEVGKKRYEGSVQWNDSEAIAIETALAMENVNKEIGTKGAAAVIGLKVDADGTVIDRIFYRNYRNPLVLHENNVMLTLTSEGKGSPVLATRVMRVKPDGGVEDHPKTMWSPSTGYDGFKGHGPYATPSDDFSTAHKSAAEISEGLPPRLPAGFRSEAEIEYAAQADQDALDFDEEDYDPDGPPSIATNVKSIRELIELDSGKFSLPLMTDDELWQSYQKCGESKLKVEEDIANLDSYVASGATLDEANIEARIKLDRFLVALTKREQYIEGEITRREAGKKGRTPAFHI